MLITENTTHFDLYKGFFFVLIACIFKSIFSLLCKILLNNNKKITSFHILAYKTYIMLGITLLLSICILYIYFTKNKEIKRGSFSLKKNKICSCCEEGKIKPEQLFYNENATILNKNQGNSDEIFTKNYKNKEENKLLYKFLYSNEGTLVFEINKKDFIFITLRSVFAIMSISLGIFSLQHLNISNYFSVYYIYPAIVILLSFLILKEKVKNGDYICLISCLIGMVFIIRPEFIFHQIGKDVNKSYYFAVIFSAIFKSMEDIITRDVGKNIHFLMIPFFYSVIGIIFFPLILYFGVNHIDKLELTLIEYFILFSIAFCSFAYQSFMALGIQNEKAGRASMINYLQIPLMFFVDMLVFHKRFLFYDIIGTFFIFIFNFGNSIIIIIQRENSLKKLKEKIELNL